MVVNIHGNQYLNYIINISFTIIDKDFIYNVPLYDTSNIKPNLICNIRNKLSSKIYFLQTRKHHHIVIRVPQFELHSFIVYDGTGFMSNVHTINNVQITSNFQCIIQLLTKSISRNIN